ncbi:hypothetical protein GCM10011376_22630 [Nocardioides flavus (ex Wang et al. 2016)]|uniref:Uncharacterized protein n=1 Tax=Nocardioides flavus (ex Wang et al. 2016) TaxID=2058780 RepID=A0ABQ3HJ15_9ACTN|nr:hypothetical protein [Nocardioides flavus (ex Wang et al. 2016)]GHE17653.1 hypothetical protein GCM10011376_22630 [Nocardioides flavus (ex Wang et al. 2016)]
MSEPQPAVERSGLPHRFEAVGEALISGSDVMGACSVAGEELARDGASVEETLAGLRAVWREATGGDPTYDVVAALLTAWSETTLGYLHQLSCEDPLTGLSSQAHLRSRLSEVYRLGGPGVPGGIDDYALVVFAMPFGDDPSDHPGDHFTRAMRLARAGELARTAFARDETVARLGLHRVGILTRRDERLGRRVQVLRTLLGGAETDTAVRVWIEGLPGTDASAGMLLDELARG